MLDTIMAMDPVTVATFLGAGIMLNLTPGADVMFAMASGAAGGVRAGVAAAFGVALGAVLHITLAVMGISAALLAIPHAHEVIRYLGAAYLLWLAVKAWRAPPPDPRRGSVAVSAAIWRGFVTNVLNPKVALFIMAFLPQFADPAIGPIWHQLAALGVMFIFTGLVITGGYGAAAGVFGGVLGRSTGLMGRISAVVFAALALRILAD